ncbi:hypothetical protein Rhopal_001084-T1 [Rhodotorula paludigena]|uniref:Uncharacterized protein n=1 Tax=Rhodotorula paludigena TaxID=86838 RepID=A0AAV5GCV3_9BASI|nr:hypothetical protein Rhopal_001084-T1 [Rhodotorula paludigena]
MSTSLPTTPFEAQRKPFLSLDLSDEPAAGIRRDLHESPTPLHGDDAAGGAASALAPSPVPHDFGFPQTPAAPAPAASDTGSVVERDEAGALGDGDEPKRGSARAAISKTQRIFRQLDSIKDLQSSIAARHAALENISGLAAARLDGDASDNDGGLGGRTKEQREKVGKAYEKTADEFARREEGVKGIMAQLAELSTALKTLHSLPAPALFPRCAVSPASDPSASPAHHDAAHSDPSAAAPPTRNPAIPIVDPPVKSDTDPVAARDEREKASALKIPERTRTGR